MNAYDLRQLRLMSNTIQKYKDDRICFKRLSDDLHGLLETLENPDIDWKNKFHYHWTTFDLYYSLSCYEQEKGFETTPFELDTDGDIPAAIETLKLMVQTELEKHNKKLLSIIDEIKANLLPEDIQSITTLVENDECELAFETLSALIDDHNIPITKDIFLRLENYAKEIGTTDSMVRVLADHIIKTG